MTTTSPIVSRRRVLGGLGAAAAALAVGGRFRSTSGALRLAPAAAPLLGATGVATDPVGRLLPGSIGDRVLVIVDCRGGNDGLSLLAPVADGRYHDLRPTLALAEGDALWLDDEVALDPALGRLRQRNLLFVEGVGPIDGDLSHFAMTERWERGDAAGTAGFRSGFLGRLTDAIDDGGPLVGVSMAGPSHHLTNTRASTLALAGTDDLWFLQEPDWPAAAAFARGLSAFDGTDDLAASVGDGYRRLADLAARLTNDATEPDWEMPMLSEGGELGAQLFGAATLLSAGVGTRIVYTSFGDFDTHQGHQWKQQSNLSQLDAALDGFLAMIDAAGASDRVLVATISEFGRRVGENDGGLDHGSASTMLLAGPVEDRRAGERPDLGSLDDDGNLVTTVPFDRYLATLAEEWLGVEAASVLPEGASPLGVL